MLLAAFKEFDSRAQPSKPNENKTMHAKQRASPLRSACLSRIRLAQTKENKTISNRKMLASKEAIESVGNVSKQRIARSKAPAILLFSAENGNALSESSARSD